MRCVRESTLEALKCALCIVFCRDGMHELHRHGRLRCTAYFCFKQGVRSRACTCAALLCDYEMCKDRWRHCSQRRVMDALRSGDMFSYAVWLRLFNESGAAWDGEDQAYGETHVVSHAASEVLNVQTMHRHMQLGPQSRSMEEALSVPLRYEHQLHGSVHGHGQVFLAMQRRSPHVMRTDVD